MGAPDAASLFECWNLRTVVLRHFLNDFMEEAGDRYTFRCWS